MVLHNREKQFSLKAQGEQEAYRLFDWGLVVFFFFGHNNSVIMLVGSP